MAKVSKYSVPPPQVVKTPPSSVSLEASPVLILPKEAFLRLDDHQRRHAFTVSGVADIEVLEEIFDLVMAGADLGIGSFLEEFEGLYKRHGLAPTTEAHARKIYSTTLRQVRAELTYRQVVESPASARLIPYLQWLAVPGTACVAEHEGAHALMHGRIYSVSHRIWRTWWHPAGHDCSCRVDVIAAPAARRMGLTGPEPTGPWPTDPQTNGPALPDLGFRSAPLPWDPREWQR